MSPEKSVPASPAALVWFLHLMVAGLLLVAAVRGAGGHGGGVGVIVGVVVCAAVYAVGVAVLRVQRSRTAARAWLAIFAATWLVLLVVTPDAVWVAFPLYFLLLHLLPRRAGLVAVVVIAGAAVAGYSAHRGSLGAGDVLGPTLGAAVAVAVVWGYQALFRESERRRQLIEELTATRADLAAAQHSAGVLAERDRLAREIHDTLAQGLTSIQLLLHAAERSLPDAPNTAAELVVQARAAAADDLAEARRFIEAMTPPALEDHTLHDALERVAAATSARHGVEVRVEFEPTGEPVATAQEVAVLRIVQSALSNVVRHAQAHAIDIAVRADGEDVVLTVTDDGVGFDAAAASPAQHAEIGYGLPTMRARARDVGGTVVIDSTPGAGTTVTARLPRLSLGVSS